MGTAKNMIVGVFVAIGLVCLSYLTIKLGRMEVLNDNGYTISARFSSVTGLRVGANVEVAGVSIGRVSAIKLDNEDYTAHVTMRIREGVRLSDDSMASVKTSGLIGDKYICLTPGGSDDNLKNGSLITDTEPVIDLEALIAKVVFGGI